MDKDTKIAIGLSVALFIGVIAALGGAYREMLQEQNFCEQCAEDESRD